MKAVTLRNIPPEVERAIKHRARQHKTSVNRAVISLLEEATGKGGRNAGRSPSIYTDLDHLIGAWTAADSAELDRALRDQRQVDQDLWR